MNIFRYARIILVVLPIISCVCLSSQKADAQTVKTSISDILKNPGRYDGKMVKVEGRVESLESKASERGNPYATFTIRDSSGGSLNVFRMGRPPVKNGDAVIVTGRYQKIKRVRGITFYDEIDATDGSVRKIR